MLGLGALFANLSSEMAERRLTFDLAFLRSTAGFEDLRGGRPLLPAGHIRRGAPRRCAQHADHLRWRASCSPPSSASSLGIARLSGNWLVSRIAFGYVELFRNTPLLVQLFLLYFAVFLALPPVRDSIVLGPVYLNQRGVYLPRPVPTDTFGMFLVALIVGLLIAVTLWVIGSRRAGAGRPLRWTGTAGLVALIGIPTLAWLAAPNAPLVIDDPVAGRFNLTGGLALSATFCALLVSLVLYTAAFIAEVVRGGIQAVAHGQREAARAIGLRDSQVLRLVVLPQALRVIVPPLTSQYLNLVKNSSLAIAIGYPDLFNVSTTVANLTGQPVAVIAFVMLIYLVISLVTSLVMNLYNRTVRIRER